MSTIFFSRVLRMPLPKLTESFFSFANNLGLRKEVQISHKTPRGEKSGEKKSSVSFDKGSCVEDMQNLRI